MGDVQSAHRERGKHGERISKVMSFRRNERSFGFAEVK